MQSILRQASRARPLASASRLTTSSRVLARPQFVRTLVSRRYTPEHEAVEFDDENGTATVYITNHAQSALGDVVFVELPALETEVEKGAQIGAVESVKAASDIYAPLSGHIIEVNEQLNDQPNLLNKSPEDKGWLCKIKVSDPSEFDKLLTEEGYEKVLNE